MTEYSVLSREDFNHILIRLLAPLSGLFRVTRGKLESKSLCLNEDNNK